MKRGISLQFSGLVYTKAMILTGRNTEAIVVTVAVNLYLARSRQRQPVTAAPASAVSGWPTWAHAS